MKAADKNEIYETGEHKIFRTFDWRCVFFMVTFAKQSSGTKILTYSDGSARKNVVTIGRSQLVSIVVRSSQFSLLLNQHNPPLLPLCTNNNCCQH